MGESLMEQRRVSEEGFRVVKLCCQGRIRIIRRGQALSGIIGRKARAGGSLSLVFKCGAQPRDALETGELECRRGERNSTCSGEMRRDVEEHQWRRRLSGL